MTSRPYLNFGAKDLEGVAQENWDSIDGLQEILKELLHRTTARAQRIEREVAARVSALGGAVPSGSQGEEAKGRPRAGGHPGGPGSESADPRVHDLTMRAVRAEQQVRELEARLQAAQSELAQRQAGSDDEIDRLYAKVGLHSSCPDFLIKAAQRTFRKEYHPDALSDRPQPEQLAAQERFKEFEQVFNRIQASRA